MAGVRALGAVSWLAVLALWAPAAYAQQDAVKVAFLLSGEEGVELRDLTIATAGLRQGIRTVAGLEYVDTVDQTTGRRPPDDLFAAIDELDPIRELVAQGDGRAAVDRVQPVIEMFEANLVHVRRQNLIDAYMLHALGFCASGNESACANGFERVIVFRESFEYDVGRYPTEHEQLFNDTRARLADEGRRGSIEIQTEPEGAEVYIDGRSIGPSPAVGEGLLIGEHYITVKAFGYEKLIQRVRVEESFQATVTAELETSDNTQLVAELLPDTLNEANGDRIGERTLRAARTLGVEQVVVGRLFPADGEIGIELHLFDARTRFRLAGAEGRITSDEPGLEAAQALAVRLYDGVDLSGQVEAPDDGPNVDGPGPIWLQWWFWTAVGVVVVSGAVTAGVLAGSGGDQLEPGWNEFVVGFSGG